MTAAQPTLFEPERFARTSDRRASKDAARRGDSFGPLTMRVLAALVEVERTCDGATTAEVWNRMALDLLPLPDRNSVARRVTTLLRRGWVRDTGSLRDGGRGVAVSVYASTTAGREALT